MNNPICKPKVKKRPCTKMHSGFSLVEMAVVMVILSSIIGGGLVTLSGAREKQQRQKTNIALEKIRDALIGYASTNGRLPCPDVANLVTPTLFDGLGDVIGTACQQNYGVLPWQDLDLEPFDSWGNYFSYHIAAQYNAPPLISCRTTIGNLQVRQNSNTGLLLADNVAAIVISHGANGAGRIDMTPTLLAPFFTRTSVSDPNETENTNNDLLFIQGAGDDQLMYLSSVIVQVKLLESNQCSLP
ncbi:MAG: type II secretion system protein [Magnetococcales bacterium]|nr:type II secretion system protein [Magnetococcales bacterium]MBF0438181.1 type II secretion system protein [Magnetococcales bacterium]